MLGQTSSRGHTPLSHFDSSRLIDIVDNVDQEVKTKKFGRSLWLSIFTATTMTMASPEAAMIVWQYATASKPQSECVAVAEFMREIGLRCMGINGIPQTINVLTAFRAMLPSNVASSLSTVSSRLDDASSLVSVKRRGCALWTSIHGPFESELELKLGKAHPDLPNVIINQYGILFANPEPSTGTPIGRIAMSLTAIASLRARGDADAQLKGHFRGLSRIGEDDSWKDDPDIDSEEAVRWLMSDKGRKWVLRKVDEVVEVLQQARQSKPTKSKL